MPFGDTCILFLLKLKEKRMNKIKKAFLRTLAALFLAIGTSCMVTGGINLAQSNIMTTGAMIYLSLCLGFLALAGSLGWQVVKYYSKKYHLDN